MSDWRPVLPLIAIFIVVATASFIIINNALIPRWIDGIEIKTYLFVISILLLLILLVFVWWAVYLPHPARWYLACARSCMFIGFLSATASIGGLGLKYFSVQLGDFTRAVGTFDDNTYERVTIFIVSLIFSDVFSRKYAKLR